jgi:hypothetical protein
MLSAGATAFMISSNMGLPCGPVTVPLIPFSDSRICRIVVASFSDSACVTMVICSSSFDSLAGRSTGDECRSARRGR